MTNRERKRESVDAPEGSRIEKGGTKGDLLRNISQCIVPLSPVSFVLKLLRVE